ncbi:MAG: hypothetical protein AAB797_03320, partial [Patescibacteria group bacterium]
ESTTKNLNFKLGYGFSSGSANGSTKNIDSNTWNFTWPTSTTPGTFSRKYTYDLTIKDAAGTAVSSTQVILTNFRNQSVFDQLTTSTGKISTQTFTYATYASSTTSTAQLVGPFNFKAIRYGYGFVDLSKDLSTKTTEEVTLSTDGFTILSEAAATALTGITLVTSTAVAYGTESTTTIGTAYTLANFPVDQSRFFAIFKTVSSTGVETKLVEGAANDYTINYGTGSTTLNTSLLGNTLRFVYSYGGKITVTSTHTTSEIYDYTHMRKANVFTTFDGSTFASFLHIQVGSSTVGAIEELTTKNVNFKSGYGWSAGVGAGSTKNIDSNTWNFTWNAAASTGTFSRQYTYDLTVKDAAGTAVSSTQVILTNFKNVSVFDQLTTSTGKIPTQTFTYATYASSTTSTAQLVGPFNFKAIKYGYGFVDLSKDLSAKTTEEVTLSTDGFTILSEASSTAITGIILVTSTPVAYGAEISTTTITSYTLVNRPVDQSRFFAIFKTVSTTGVETKLVEGAANDYTINYGTGAVTFNVAQTSNTLRFVYSYGGRISITGTHTTSEIYDYTHAQKANVFTTFDGTTYASFVDIKVGTTTIGAIEE